MFRPSKSSRKDEKDCSAPTSSLGSTNGDSPRSDRGRSHDESYLGSSYEEISKINSSSPRHTSILRNTPMIPNCPKKTRYHPISTQQNPDPKRPEMMYIENQTGHRGHPRSANDGDRGGGGGPDTKSSSKASERDVMMKVPDTKSKGTNQKAGAFRGADDAEVKKSEGEKRGRSSPNKMLKNTSEGGVKTMSAAAPILGAHNLSVVIYNVEPGEVGIRQPPGAPGAKHALQWSLFLRTSVNPYKGISSEFHSVCGKYLYTEARQSRAPNFTPGFRKEEPLGFIDPEYTKKYLEILGDDCIRDGPHPWNAKKWVLEVLARLCLDQVLPMEEYQSACHRVSAMGVSV
jgi:hypothetical protein